MVSGDISAVLFSAFNLFYEKSQKFSYDFVVI